jgi:hypothetical protein
MTFFRIAACGMIFAILFFPVSGFTAQEQPDILYPGISAQQHALAREVMHEFFAQHWLRAGGLARDMRNLEQSDSLLPLSDMLRFAMPAWRIINSEFDSRGQGDSLFRELEPLRRDCLWILHHRHFADSTLPTRMFLEAGINGFNATLIIRSNPLASLTQGLRSFRTLDSLRAIAPQIKDLYLGLGLFQCALANEPGIIGFALHLFGGLHVSLDSGLAYLRICSNEALYTQVGAKEYLIQFLSPFNHNEAGEKQAVFRSLEQEFPGNPYYVFQEIDEQMAFHRESAFEKSTCDWALAQIAGFDTSNSTTKLYANCVKWQCTAIDTSLAATLGPRPFGDRECLSFYPVFLEAAKARYVIDSDSKQTVGKRRNAIRSYHELRNRAYVVLRRSEINPMLREYYLWHLDDGLP